MFSGGIKREDWTIITNCPELAISSCPLFSYKVEVRSSFSYLEVLFVID